MPRLSSHVYRIWVFIVGVIATIAYRLVVVLNYYSQFWVEVAWYIGTIGFIWYFAHRYRVENRRDKLIEKLELIKKMGANQSFKPEDKAALLYVLKSLETSLAKWNYIAIFLFSGLAMAYAMYVDLSAIFK
ncbi:hypothetical protein A3H09_02425 [Candidatus Falkowbacteria bacterium RIFCSPLOWO2_12_FULL_45_13]|uniref:Uncharacterized protein n=2 Tax=Candidatus Falkowiibacteriota TaxID=1752728 RepID=A0A1F5SD25_9BACT|nr:MAG: hypothetical protein A3H66_00245 [Candidatus Falkowbacteria bacterium RIFCSPLOWO2_02_FULL_45_21]OGF31191.1 MAG: hypothetical protein A3H09_02425 [Candidatus Falkowbacteria bacterium RIFCSPLOWO2_12_FULL_45_13]